MKKITCTLMMVFVLTFAAAAVANQVYTYEASKGTVTFNHDAHKERVDGDCSKCHKGTPGKFEVTKKVAHTELCKKCHKAMNGPTRCNACHIK